MIKEYLTRRARSTNTRVLMEISKDYNAWRRVMGNHDYPKTKAEFYNMSFEDRFKILYDYFGVEPDSKDIQTEVLYRGLTVVIILFMVVMHLVIV